MEARTPYAIADTTGWTCISVVANIGPFWKNKMVVFGTSESPVLQEFPGALQIYSSYVRSDL